MRYVQWLEGWLLRMLAQGWLLRVFARARAATSRSPRGIYRPRENVCPSQQIGNVGHSQKIENVCHSQKSALKNGNDSPGNHWKRLLAKRLAFGNRLHVRLWHPNVYICIYIYMWFSHPNILNIGCENVWMWESHIYICIYIYMWFSHPNILTSNVEHSTQDWRKRTPISHEPLICSQMCFTKTELVQ